MKNYVAHSTTVVCVTGWISRERKVCLHSLALHAYEVSCRSRIFPPICIWQQDAYNIRRISNLLKTFEVRTLSNSNLNFVTSLA